MIQLNDSAEINKYVAKLNLKQYEYKQKVEKRNHAQNVFRLCLNDHAAIELQLSNLITTYGANKIKNQLNELTRLKKAV